MIDIILYVEYEIRFYPSRFRPRFREIHFVNSKFNRRIYAIYLTVMYHL